MLIIGLGILAICASTLPKVNLDYDFEKFFPKNDQELDFYLNHREQFATDNDFLLIALQPDEGVFNPAFLDKLSKFTTDCQQLPHVEFATSITNVKLPVKTPLGWAPAPLFQSENLTQETRASDSLRVIKDPLIKDRFISTNGKAVLVLIKHLNSIPVEKGNELLASFDQALEQYSFDEIHISGKLYGQRYYIQKMGLELGLFASISLVLLAVFLFISFRSFWAIWLPIAVVGSTVVVLLSVFYITGTSLSVLTTIMPTILFVVGISDVVHLLEKIIAEIRSGKSKIDAIRIAYREVGLATFLTTLTTSIGFFTLILSPIRPIGEFALFTGIGVWIAFALTFTLFPAALIFLHTPTSFKKASSSFSWEQKLETLLRFTFKRKAITALASAIVLLVCACGASLVEVNNFIVEDLSESDPQKQDYTYLENTFSGVRPFDFNIKTTDTQDLLTPSKINALLSLETYLTETYGAGSLSSPLSLIRVINRGLNGGSAEHFTVPTDSKQLDRIKKIMSTKRFAPFLKTVLTPDFSEGRILGRIKDYGGKVFKVKNKDLQLVLDDLCAKNQLQMQQTGMGYLIDRNNEKLSTGMLTGLGLSFVIIGLIMALLFKNWRMIVISLIPNMIPLIMIAAVMGYFGINLKVATSIIFTIAFGIAVDDTIHLLSRFKLELNRTKNPLKALYISYVRTGKAVIVTSLILFSGFIALWFSTFASTFYLGLLVSLTLLFAVLADVIIIPLLICFFYRKQMRQHKFMQG